TQLDLEMSFVEREDVLQLVEELFKHLWRECIGITFAEPFTRVTYDEAIRRFGTDHVDMRYGMELADLNDVFANTALGVFKSVIASGGVIRGFALQGGAGIHKNELRKLEHQAMERGAKGLAWVKLGEDGIESPLAKHLTTEEIDALRKATGAATGDVVFMVADRADIANPILGSLRMQVASERGLIPPDEYRFCWIIDVPYFELDAETKRWVPMHHPFTMPAGGAEALDGDPATVKSLSYDLVLNGTELLSGSIRIHHPDTQRKVFDALGIDPQTAQERFGFFIEAFKYGPPPHGGIGCGIDRVMMTMLHKENVRDVIAFPKTKSGVDAMSGAPTAVDQEQLKILGLKIVQ
ncbi:MAG: aspartate--tRNA ligase, partial [Actinobacteria bacterium]|nr:aspartate--tRNA ligase [Actinomycetota bacterium]